MARSGSLDARSARSCRRPHPATPGSHRCPSCGSPARAGPDRGGCRAARPVRGSGHELRALALVHLKRGHPDLAIAVLQRGLHELVGDALRIGPLLALLVVAEIQRGDSPRRRRQQIASSRSPEFRRRRGAVVASHVARARVLAGRATTPELPLVSRWRSATIGNDERPMLLATVRLELAEALARSGEQAAAIAEARAALSCFERLGADAYRDRLSALLRSLGDTARARPQRADEVTAALSVREQEVLELVSHGLSNAEIASRLFISPKTAEHHVGRILTKLGVRSRGEAAALAVRLAACPNLSSTRIGVAIGGSPRRRRRPIVRSCCIESQQRGRIYPTKGITPCSPPSMRSPRHLPALDPRSGGRPRRLLVQPVPDPRRAAVPVPHGHAPAVSHWSARLSPRSSTLEDLRWISFGHVEADECGAMNLFLADAPEGGGRPRGAPAWSRSTTWPIDRRTSIGRRAARHRRASPAIHPDPARAPRLGERPVVRRDDQHACSPVTCSRHLGDVSGDRRRTTSSPLHWRPKRSSTAPRTAPTWCRRSRTLAPLEPTTLATMHGSSYRGDGATAAACLGRGLRGGSGRGGLSRLLPLRRQAGHVGDRLVEAGHEVPT